MRHQLVRYDILRCEECGEAFRKEKQQLASSEVLMHHSPDSLLMLMATPAAAREVARRTCSNLKGVTLKTVIKKPKKPNSAKRACLLVHLPKSKKMAAYVPGIGHNLQEHNIVLVRVGRLKDCPGVKLKCVPSKYDLPQVIKQKV